MNRLQVYVDGCPRWAKASSRACRMMLLAFIPIGSLSPCGMRMLDAYGVCAPAADLMLVLPSAPSRLIADHYGRYGFCK